MEGMHAQVLKLVEAEQLGKMSVRDTKTHGDMNRLSAFKLQKKTDGEEKGDDESGLARIARLVESLSETVKRSHALTFYPCVR